MTAKISNVLIVGGGTAGWMTATALSSVFGDSININLVESDEIGTVGVGEATVPPILQFNQLAGIDEREFLAATNGTFKLGIEFVNWYEKGHAYLHPFGVYGAKLGPLAFHEYWQKAYLSGKAKDIEHYSLICQAAKKDKYNHPDYEGNSILSQMGYAYHFDAGLYAAFLREMCQKRGVTRIEGKIAQVQTDEKGFVNQVVLESGQSVDGDLFIDCSGFRALLLGQTCEVGYDDWSQWLPCNRAIAVPTENIKPPTPYTRSTAHEAGWQWRIPLQHRVGNGHVYAADFMEQAQAEQTLLNHLDAPILAQPRHLQFTAGVRDKIWHNNVVAIGLSAGFLEPLESTSIHLIQRGIARLLENFPDMGFSPLLMQRYNRQVILEYHQIRDFIIMHYKLTKRDDSEFWRYCRHMPIPDSLQERIDLYQQSGRVYRIDEEMFNVTSWLAVMHGQGLRARDYMPLADAYNEDKLSKELRSIENVIERASDDMLSHQAYLQQYLASTQKQKVPA